MSEEASGRTPMGPGWSAEPEPHGVSALAGDHPSRGVLVRMVDALQGAHIDMGSPWHWDMEQATTLARVALSVHGGTGWFDMNEAPQDGRWVWGEWPEIVGATAGESAPRVVALMRWGRPIGDSHLLPHWCREGRWTPENPTRWAPVNPPPAPGMDAEGQDAERLGAEHDSPIGVAEAPQPDLTPKGE